MSDEENPYYARNGEHVTCAKCGRLVGHFEHDVRAGNWTVRDDMIMADGARAESPTPTCPDEDCGGEAFRVTDGVLGAHFRKGWR